MSDVRFALRQLLNNPGFTAVAVLTIALGIGANTAIFSVLYGLWFRPLPYPQPDRLVTLWESSPDRGIEQERVSGPNYLDWRQQNTVFADMAVTPGWDGVEDFNLVQRDSTVKIRASYSSASLFSTLGTPPVLGRTLLPEEDRKEGNRAVVLSHGLWKSHFEADPEIIGRSLTLDTYGRRTYEIVGVMPPGFGLPSRIDLWLPLGWMDVSLDERRSAHWHNVIARLKPGVTLAQARSELSGIQARLKQAYPEETIGSTATIVPLLDQALGPHLKTALLVLWGVVTGVLLIACANVANLVLARTATRQKEMALRLALGAGRARLVRQLLVESVLLAILGGGIGILLGAAGIQLFIAASPADMPRLDAVRLDITALAFTLGVSLATGLLFGLAPALQFSRADLNEALKDNSRSAVGGIHTHRTRALLVISEVALSVVLLAGAGLMLQSFARMLRAERGFQSEHLLTAELDFSVSGFTTWVRPTATRPQVPLKSLLDQLRTYPGVQIVGAGSRLLRRENRPPHESFSILGRREVPPEEQPRAEFKGITPDWIRALGARLLRGRDFDESDTLEAKGVVLINETLARRYFPNEDPVGQRLRMGTSQPPIHATNVWGLPEWSEIIGVVSDIRSLHPRPEAVAEAYFPYWQWPMQNPTILVRTRDDPSRVAETIRRQTKLHIPNLPPPIIRTMDELLAETVAQPRLQAGLLTLFASLALVLAGVGIYGVLGYTVTQRKREIGIRLALGASKGNVLRLIMGEGMRLAFVGIVIGVIAALGLTRVIRGLLYGVTPHDPLVFCAAAMLLMGVALVACWRPARRATHVEPMETLREG